PAPPPLSPFETGPLTAPWHVTVERLHAVVGIGVTLDLPRIESTLSVPVLDGRTPGAPVLHIRTLRLVRPEVTAPIDTIITGINFFVTILEPRVRVDELVVEDGRVGELAAPWLGVGRWLWRVRDLDLRARDVWLGGRDEGLTERLRIVRASGTGEVKGRPFRLERAAVTAERTAETFEADAAVSLPRSRLAAHLVADRPVAWRTRIVAEPFAFAELRAFLPWLPSTGTGSSVVWLRGRRRLEGVRVERLDVAVGRSHLAGHGSVALGPEPRFDDVLVEAAPLRARDAARLFGVTVPGGGTWVGWARAAGTLREGVGLRAELAHEQEGGEVSRLTLDGRIITDPAPFIDVAITGAPIHAADTAFDVALRLRGPAEAVRVRGDLAVRGIARTAATLDAVLRYTPAAPPVLTGQARLRVAPDALGVGADGAGADGAGAPARPVHATATGRAVLAEGGALAVRVTADSVPLALIPFPEPVDSVRGAADAVAVIGGTVDRPTVRGSARIRGGGLFVQPLALDVDEIRGAVRLADGTLATDRIVARAGGGTLEVRGRARVLEEPRRLSLSLHADSVRLVRRDSADVTLSADLTLTGPPELPRLDGRVYDVHGWLREDLFRPSAPLDPDDPPYADLAREVPWPEDSRLRRIAPEPPFPLRGRVVVEVGPDLSVVDEDSDLFGAGRLHVRLREEGPDTRGVIRLLGGFYALFGERFRVTGGAARFEGDGLLPHIALIAEHENGRTLGEGRIETATAPDRFPPLELFSYGPAGQAREQLRRWSLLPETQEQLAELLLFGNEPQPVTGWRYPRLWRADSPADRFDVRAETQATSLLWSYIADQAYDYVPLSRGRLWTGHIEVGSRYPARIVIGPLIAAGVTLGRDIELLAAQPLIGGEFPGLRVRWTLRGTTLQAFTIPRFYAAAQAGAGHPGFSVRRKTGLGVLWQWEF
ncbi:MAG TPA: translocation/assembly module TamB domain-containing protein, partial [Longimicrobiales bacterium]